MKMPAELADFRRFLWLTWKTRGLPDPTPVQYEIADIIQNVLKYHGIVPLPYDPKFLERYPMLVDEEGRVADRVIIEAYRGFGKSIICSTATDWILGWNGNAQIMAVSAANVKANEFTTDALQLLRDIEILNPLRPQKALGDRSSTHGFDVRGAQRTSQAPSVRSSGIFGQITGGRGDVLFLDDIEVPKTSETQVLRDKLWTRSAELGGAVLKPSGVVLVLGTPQCEESIYQKMERERGYKVVVFPARVPDAKHMQASGYSMAPAVHAMIKKWGAACQTGGGLDGTRGWPTDPDRFDEEELCKREAEYGRSGFDMQFQLNTILSDANRYPLKLRDLIVMDVPRDKAGMAPESLTWASSPELMRNDLEANGLHGDRFYRPFKVAEKWLPMTGCAMFIDPAGRGADELAYAIAKCCNGYIYLVECRGLRGGYEMKNLIHLAQRAKFHGVNEIITEPNFGDGMFDELFKPVLRDHYPCTLTPGERAVMQKERRIIDVLEPVMNQHFLVVDPQVIRDDMIGHDDESAERTHTRSLFWQMTRITKEKGCLKHDDRLDALAGIVAYWMRGLGIDLERSRAEREDEALREEVRRYYATGVTPTGARETAHSWINSEDNLGWE